MGSMMVFILNVPLTHAGFGDVVYDTKRCVYLHVDAPPEYVCLYMKHCFQAKSPSEAGGFVTCPALDLMLTLPDWLHLEGVAPVLGFNVQGTSSDGTSASFETFIPLSGTVTGSSVGASLPLDPDFQVGLGAFLARFDEDDEIIIVPQIAFDAISLSNNDPAVILQPFESTWRLVCASTGDVLLENTETQTLADIMGGYLTSAVEQVPAGAFKNPSQQGALVHKIGAVMDAFMAGDWSGATHKLEKDVMSKFDGQPGGKSQQDWVVDSSEAADLHGIFEKVDVVLQSL
jgi:hypothetical protein